MKVFADFLRMFHHFNQFVREILWMRCHKTNSFQSLDLLNFGKKLCKGHRMFQCLSVRIYILTKQHHFYDAICHEPLDLTDDIFRISAAFTATHIRHDTVATEVVTAKHNIDTGFEGKFPLTREIFHNLVCIFPNINDHAL